MSWWFPQLNSFNEIASGNGSIWLNGQPFTPMVPGHSPQWISDFELLIDGDVVGARIFHVQTREVRPLGHAFNARVGNTSGICAGAGKWCGWNNAEGLIYEGTSIDPSAAPGCVDKQTGALYYLTPYQSKIRNVILNGIVVRQGVIATEIVAGEECATWGEYSPQRGLVGWAPEHGIINLSPLAPSEVLFVGVPVRTPLVGSDQLWVITQTHKGLIAHPWGKTQGHIIEGDWLYHDARYISDGVIRIVATDNQGRLKDTLIRITAPRVELRDYHPTTGSGIITPINRPLWLGFFAGTATTDSTWRTNTPPESLPGNSFLLSPDGKFCNKQGTQIGTFITGISVEEIEAKCRQTSYIAIAYWDARLWPRYPLLPTNSWLCLQAYCRTNETLDQFESSLRAILTELHGAHPQQHVALVAQCYTSNNTLTADLAALVPVFSRLASVFPNVRALLPFSGSGRASGLQDHPAVRPWWDQLAATIPAAPVENTMPAPRFTITAPGYAFPISANVPFALRCVYVNEPSGGVPDWIEWLYSNTGANGPWTVAVRNPGSDEDHTYRFSSPGNVWIRARAGNGAGTHETQLARQIILADHVTPEPPKPEPPKPPAGDKMYLRTTHGGYLCVKDHLLTQGPKQAFEIVKLVSLDNSVALKANGKFAATEDDRRIKVDRDAVGSEWEKFWLKEHEGFVSLQSQRTGINAGYISAHDDGSVMADQPHALSWESFTPEAAPDGSGGAVAGHLDTDGRMLRDGSGAYYRPVWSSALAILTREHEPFLDWLSNIGFNGCRVFCGNLGWAGQTPQAALNQLPGFLSAALARGLRVEVTALTGTKDGGYDPQNYISQTAEICKGFDNAILEMANEPWHPSQDGLTPAFLNSCMPVVPSIVIAAFGAAEEDESSAYAGGDYITVHLDRSRDEWNMVRRVRELEALSVTNGKFVMNNEPIKAGSQNSNPSIFFTFAVLNRIFEVGGVYHSDAGLQGRVPDGQQQQLAEAFIRGSRVITGISRMTFKNSGWHDSPIKEFSGAVRVYSGLSDDENVTCALGIGNGFSITTQNGWSLGEVLDEMAGVKVYRLNR